MARTVPRILGLRFSFLVPLVPLVLLLEFFDATGRVAYINDQMIELSARELSLLEVLLQRAGRLVSKDQLVERLCEWGDEVSNNAIEVYIHRLRKKIEQGPVRIATVRGLGYCLEKIAG